MQATTGLLLPTDPMCTPEILASLEDKYEEDYKIVPEAVFEECWDGLDRLLYIEETLTDQGRRKLQGFTAAGGLLNPL